jgi:hypothetical protein
VNVVFPSYASRSIASGEWCGPLSQQPLTQVVAMGLKQSCISG